MYDRYQIDIWCSGKGRANSSRIIIWWSCTSFGKIFFEKNQAVVGAIFDSEFNVYEDICFSEDEYNAKGFIRSKYVQSETRDCFTKVKEALSMGKEVLFIGTPCQVAAIKAFTGEPESLYTVDFVCHGGPSSKVFQEYLKYQEDRYNSDITAVDFRIKKAKLVGF